MESVKIKILDKEKTHENYLEWLLLKYYLIQILDIKDKLRMINKNFLL